MSRPNVKIKTLGEVDAKTQYGFRMTSALLDRLRVHCAAYHEPIGEFIEAAVVKALDEVYGPIMVKAEWTRGSR